MGRRGKERKGEEKQKEILSDRYYQY